MSALDVGENSQPERRWKEAALLTVAYGLAIYVKPALIFRKAWSMAMNLVTEI